MFLTAERQNVLLAGMNLGQRLKQLRESRHLTQAQLASKIGRIQPEIFRWEKGKVRIPAENLPALARALEVPILAFFDESKNNLSSYPIDWELVIAASYLSDEARAKLVEFLRVSYCKDTVPTENRESQPAI